MADESAKRGILFWLLVFAGGAAALFFGSAIVAGVMQGQEAHAARKKAEQLTSAGTLLGMIPPAMKKTKGVPATCWYIGAIGYRLAEARDLEIPKPYAIELANDAYLVEDLAKHGFNAKHVIGGIAAQVYDSPLSPNVTFDVQSQACAGGRP